MYHRYVALIIFACTFATLSPLRTYATSLPAVVLSEIQWGGSALSTADEWIELANVSSESVDISSWKITGIASQGAEIAIPPATILPSRATYLVANYALGDAKTALAVSPNLVSSSVSISNSSLTATLITADGTTIDSYSDQKTPGMGSSSPHASAERNLDDGTWFTAIASHNLLAEETFGSPGYALFPAVVAALIEQEELPNAEIQEELLLNPEDSQILDEMIVAEEALSSDLPETPPPLEPSSSEIIIEVDPSTPEEAIIPFEEDVAIEEQGEDLVTEEDSVEIEAVKVEIVTLIAPIITEAIVSAVEEIHAENISVDAESSLEETTIPNLSLSQDDSDSVTTKTLTITKTLDYSTLHITEFLSSPSEGNEWVELWNSGAEDIALDGVNLTDASGKITALSGILSAGDYLIIENPKGKLNNNDDTLIVTLPDGQILFTLTYGTKDFPAPKKGSSAGLCDNGWHVHLVPSPASKNSCSATTLQSTTYDNEISNSQTLELSSSPSGTSSAIQGDVPVAENTRSTDTPIAQVTTSVVNHATVSVLEKTSSASQETPSSSTPANKSLPREKKAPSKNTVLSVELGDLEQLPSGQQIKVVGTLVAEPGAFGKRIAYLNGIQLYFHKATWPSLPFGTLVQLVGTWDYDGDTRRIKISHASDIEILGLETVQPSSWDNVSAETASDTLVTASGILVKKEGDVFIFSSLTGKDFRVVDEAKTGSLAALRAGDQVTVTGMIFPSDGNWILAPRSADDVVIATPAIPTQETPSASFTALASAPQSSNISSTPIVGGGILVSSISALGYWFFRSKKLSLLFS